MGGSIGRRLGPAGPGCVTSQMSATPLPVMLGQPPGLAPGSSSGGIAVLGCCALAALHMLYIITAKSRCRYCFQRIGEKHEKHTKNTKKPTIQWVLIKTQVFFQPWVIIYRVYIIFIYHMYNYQSLCLADRTAGTKICPTMCAKQFFLIADRPAGWI